MSVDICVLPPDSFTAGYVCVSKVVFVNKSVNPMSFFMYSIFFHINQIFKTNWINFTADVSQNREMEGTAAAQRRAPQRLALRDRHSPIANLLGLYPGVWAKIVFFPINMNMDHYRIRWATLVIFCLMVLIHINLQCFIHGHGSIAIGPIASGYITVCYG